MSGGGGGKTLGYLLTAFIALAASATLPARAATKPDKGFYWTGLSSGQSEFNDTSCWKYYNGSTEVGKAGKPQQAFEGYGSTSSYKGFFRSDYDSVLNTTVTFAGARKMYGDLTVAAGSSSSPYVFTATDSSYGLTSTANLIVGDSSDGYLQIDSGTYKFKQTKIATESGKTGTLKVSGGTFTSSSYLCVGSGGTGCLEITGGTVSNGADDMPIGDTSTGTVTVNGGKYANSHDYRGYGIRVGCNGAGTLNVQSGEVELTGGALGLCTSSGKSVSGTVNITGGTVTTSQIKHGDGSGTGTLTIDGGTVCACADNVDFIPAHDNLNVYVGANGATIDTGDHNITIGVVIEDKSGEAGTVTFTGGGTATITAAQSYTGGTTVEIGTTLKLNSTSASSVLAKLTVAIPETTPAAGVYAPITIDGDYTLDSSVLANIVKPEDSTLRLSSDRKSVLCIYGSPANTWTGGATGSLSDSDNWSLSIVPQAGDNCIIGNTSAATLTVGSTFAPASITFAADSAAITISAADEGTISGITAVTNLSSVVQEIACPLTFANNYRVYCATQPVNFSGGATATYPDPDMADNAASHKLVGSITFTAAWTQATVSNPYTVPSGSVLHGQDARGTGGGTFLSIESGGKAYFTTAYVATGVSEINTDGELHVDGVITIGPSTGDYTHLTHDENDTGVIYAGGIYKNNNKRTYIKVPTLYIGSSGIAADQDWVINFSDAAKTVYATADFEISGVENTTTPSDWGLSINRPVTFNTQGHTITWTAGAKGADALIKDGEGTLVMNPYGSALTGAVTVNGGTLALAKSDATGTGAVTVKDGATLEVAQSGTVALGGDLTLADGATLKFTFTKRAIAPVLDLTSKTVTFGDQKEIKVTLSGERPAYGSDGIYFLTNGGGFSDEEIQIAAAEQPKWVKAIGLYEGNIYAEVYPAGMMILFR